VKNIKKYQEFILEYDANFDTRSKPILMKKGDSVVDVIKQYAPWYFNDYKDITPIFRGFKGSKYERYGKSRPAFTISPSNHKRYSRHTDNHYTEMIDNSPYWEDYPKRSESIVCTSARIKAATYGVKYRVIPLKENARFGVCSSNDIWVSFKYLLSNLKKVSGISFEHMNQFNDWLSFAFGIPDDYDITHKDIEGRIFDVMYDINDTDKDDWDDWNWNDDIRYFAKRNIKGTLHFNDFYDTLQEWMSPENNNFELINYNVNSEIPYHRELWTDVDCLLIREDILIEELGEPNEY
jgi:hypothetical protein